MYGKFCMIMILQYIYLFKLQMIINISNSYTFLYNTDQHQIKNQNFNFSKFIVIYLEYAAHDFDFIMSNILKELFKLTQYFPR